MRVLISGAGIAGPTLAWFLAKTGARITVVEKSHTLLPHGQNVDIQGSALSVIIKMGLLEQVRRAYTTGRDSTSFTSEFEILRGDLAAILHGATKDHPNINYMLGTTIKEVRSSDADNVRVILGDGEVQEFDLLVAADGQWSKVRRQIFPPESVTVVPLGMYVVYWTIPRMPDDSGWWDVYLAGGSRIITLRPDPHGTTRAMFTIMPCNDAQEKAWIDAAKNGRAVQQDLLREEFADAGWQAERLLNSMDKAPDFYFHVLEQIKMAKWSTSRVVCIGDTAHAPTPCTGMGTSLALSGAYVLAGELSKLKRNEHPLRALEAYENIYRPFVEEMQKIPRGFPGLAHPETLWKRWLFHRCISAVSKVVAIPWIVSRFGDETHDQGFPLPQYSTFDQEISCG
ncbi:MAG: hypothetical protein Q9182_006271 [Xanthomendoza sp. 2 TL-2023]